MENFDLVKYVNTLLELEKEKRTLNLAIQKNSKLVSQMGVPRKIQQGKVPEPQVEITPMWVAALEYAIAVFGSIFLGYIIDKIIVLTPFAENSFLGRGLGVVLAIVMAACVNKEIRESDEESCQKALERKKAEQAKVLQRYEEELAADKVRIAKEEALAAPIKRDIAILQQQYQKTSNLLEQYYALNVIHPQYRNLIAVGTFAGYLETGRCSVLEGHEGCYNLFEQEKRTGLIITKLDMALQKLHNLCESQSRLADALEASNHTAQKLCSYVEQTNHKLDTINQHQAVLEYQTAQTARNTRFLADYTVWRDVLNG